MAMKVLDIDETTRLPLIIVWVVIMAVFGGAVWVTKIDLTLTDAQANVLSLQSDVKDISLDRVKRRDELSAQIHRLELQMVAIREHFKIPEPKDDQ